MGLRTEQRHRVKGPRREHKFWPPGPLGSGDQDVLSLFPPLFSHVPAEESAPSHSCQSPSPASQEGEEEKGGTLFRERTVLARNAKVRANRGWERPWWYQRTCVTPCLPSPAAGPPCSSTAPQASSWTQEPPQPPGARKQGGGRGWGWSPRNDQTTAEAGLPEGSRGA